MHPGTSILAPTLNDTTPEHCWSDYHRTAKVWLPGEEQCWEGMAGALRDQRYPKSLGVAHIISYTACVCTVGSLSKYAPTEQGLISAKLFQNTYMFSHGRMKHRNFPSSSKCKPSLKLLIREGVSVVLLGAWGLWAHRPAAGRWSHRKATCTQRWSLCKQQKIAWPSLWEWG